MQIPHHVEWTTIKYTGENVPTSNKTRSIFFPVSSKYDGLKHGTADVMIVHATYQQKKSKL